MLKENIFSLPEDCYLNISSDMDEINDDKRSDVISVLGILLLTSYIKVSSLQAERCSKNIPSLRVLPPVFPSQLCSLRIRQFWAPLSCQKYRLPLARGADYIFILEDKIQTFKRYVSNGSSALEDLQRYDRCSARGCGVFHKAWLPFRRRFEQLVKSVEGLPDVFLCPFSLESQFSVLQFRKDMYCVKMSNISLEKNYAVKTSSSSPQVILLTMQISLHLKTSYLRRFVVNRWLWWKISFITILK